eukprot:2951667-Prymnesium_polylepis.1
MPASRRLSRRRVLDDETGADDCERRGDRTRADLTCSGPVSLFIHASTLRRSSPQLRCLAEIRGRFIEPHADPTRHRSRMPWAPPGCVRML